MTLAFPPLALAFLKWRPPPPPPPPAPLPSWPVVVLSTVEQSLPSLPLALGLLLICAACAFAFASATRAAHRRATRWDAIDPAVLKAGGSRGKLEAAAEAGVDVVIIGSGLSGLSCGAILSKAGLRVVVLEQHDVAGGCTHTFEDGGFEFDVGVHYLGGQLNWFLSPVRRAWKAVSDGQLEWTPSDPTFDVCYNRKTGESLGFTSSGTGDAALKQHFSSRPGASAALARYRLYQLAGVAVSMVFFGLKLLPPFMLRLVFPVFAPLWRQLGCASVADVLARCDMKGELRDMAGALTYLYGDYGSRPQRAPWFVHALVSTHYYFGGAFFPTGGSASIAKTLVAGILRRGGKVFVRAPVSEITIENGRAVGVVCRGVELRAKVAVISAAGFRNTFGTADKDAKGQRALLPEEVAAPTRALLQSPGGTTTDKPERVPASMAFVYLFVGLDASDEELGIKARNVWSMRDFDHEAAFAHFNQLDLNPCDVPSIDDLPAVFLGSASAKDSSWPSRHPGKAAMTVLCPVKAEWFERWEGTKIKNRGDEYKDVKALWASLLLEALYKHWPQTKGHVVYSDVATPLSNDFYLASSKGEAYGLDHVTTRFDSMRAMRALHPQTLVPGLFMTGQDIAVVGVVTAMVAGAITATRVSYRAGLRFMLEMMFV